MIGRIIGTVVAVLLYGWGMTAFSPVATLITSEVAGKQFENSDQSYLQSVWTMGFFSHLGALLSLALLVVLILIWFKPVRDAIKNASTSLVVLLALGGVLLSSHDSHAFFDKTDRTEIIPVPPNWSAFWIPGFGANKDTQAQMNTQAYLEANKVAVKYFQVPHSKLSGSAGFSLFSGADYYVNNGVLILVDRTRFSREWVDAADRGTSVKKEGFPCQSKEGLNITVGVSIGSYVTETDAAKFLYNFGVQGTNPYKPTGYIEQDGQSVFQSVSYGRSLKEVMDDVGRKKVQTLVCDQIGIRTFDKANEEMVKIMEQVKKDATTYFASVGITLDFIGWADTFGFDHDVQNAVNRKYIALQDEDIAKRLQPYSDIIKALAVAQATRTFGDKTDGKLPQTYVGMTPEVTAVLGQLLRTPAPAVAPAPAR